MQDTDRFDQILKGQHVSDSKAPKVDRFDAIITADASEPSKAPSSTPNATGTSSYEKSTDQLVAEDPRRNIPLGQHKDDTFNPKTGKWYRTPFKGTVPVLDAPSAGFQQAKSGLFRLLSGEAKTPAGGGRAHALHDVVSGAFQIAEPLMVAGAVAAPVSSAVALAGSVVGGQVGQRTAKALGAGPGVQELSGDVGTIVGGGVAAKAEGAIEGRPKTQYGAVPEPEAPVASETAEAPRSEPVKPVETPVAKPPVKAAVKAQQSFVDRFDAIVGESKEPTPIQPDVPRSTNETSITKEPDVLSTGESQPRLPGDVGDVRDQEVAQPKVAEVPQQSLTLTAPPETEPTQPALVKPDVPKPKLVHELDPAVREELQNIHSALSEFAFQRGTVLQGAENDAVEGSGFVDSSSERASYEGQKGSNLIKHTAGDPVYHDLGQGTYTQKRQAIEKYLAGGKPSAIAMRAIRVAERRLGAPSLPTENALSLKATIFPRDVKPIDTYVEESLTRKLADAMKTDVGYKYADSHAQAIMSSEVGQAVQRGIVDMAREDGTPEEVEAAIHEAVSILKGTLDEGPVDLHGGLGFIGGLPEAAKNIVDRMKTMFNPKGASKDAARTADMVRGGLADITNAEDIRRVQGAADRKQFDRQTDPFNIWQTSEFERHGEFPGFGLADFTQRFREAGAQAYDWLEQTFGGDKNGQASLGDDFNVVGYVQNYVRHAFKFGSEADETRGLGVLQNRIKSLSANKSVLKRRALRMPLDEALEALKNAGVKAEPVTTNPELLRQWMLNNAYRALRFKQLGDNLKDSGMIHFVKTGETPPKGMVSLSDRRFQTFFKGDQGLVKAGEFYASEPVAKLLNNVVSKGLSGNLLFRGLRSVNNMANQWNLGFSAFHATETVLNSAASDIARGIEQFYHRQPVAGAKSFGRAATVIGPAIGQYVRGDRFIEGLIANDPAMKSVLDEVVNPAGARLAIDKRQSTDFFENLQRSWTNGSYMKAAGEALGSIPQVLSKPLMEKAIPRIKLGAFLDLADDVKSRMPNATKAQLAHAYGEAWNSIDNRFGMLTYDNLFWNRTAVDIGQLMVRSLGWTHGTELELGGGVLDAGKMLTKRGTLTHRTSFLLALPAYVGMMGAVYQYLHTGKKPETVKDLFYPQNGRLDANGNPDRAQLKSYMSDAVNFVKDPRTTLINKASPLASWAYSALPILGSNRDYFGDLVRNPDDPAVKQMQEWGEFTLSNLFGPISLKQMFQTSEEGVPLLSEPSLERGFAIQKAPSWATRTPQQNAASKLLSSRLGERHRTPEQVETDTVKLKARQEIKAGGRSPALTQLIQRGEFATPEALQRFVEGAQKTPYERTLAALPIADRIRILTWRGGKQ